MNISVGTESIFVGTRPAGGPGSRLRDGIITCLIASRMDEIFKKSIWIFLFHFSFVSSASWLVLGGVMSARHQVAIALLRIVFLCDGWLRRAVPISCIRIIHLHEFFFIRWAGSRAKDDCYVGHTHCSLQDNLESTVHSMFTVQNVFGA